MKSLYKEFEPIGKEWLLDLNKYNEVPFQRKTSMALWSISEIYESLGYATLTFHLNSISEALENPQKGSKTWAGKMVFLKKSFNNKKLNEFMLEYYSAPAAENLAQAKDTMYKVLKKMEETSTLITDSNIKNTSEHPILGFLSIAEWYKLVIFQFEYLKKRKEKIHQLITR